MLLSRVLVLSWFLLTPQIRHYYYLMQLIFAWNYSYMYHFLHLLFIFTSQLFFCGCFLPPFFFWGTFFGSSFSENCWQYIPSVCVFLNMVISFLFSKDRFIIYLHRILNGQLISLKTTLILFYSYNICFSFKLWFYSFMSLSAWSSVCFWYSAVSLYNVSWWGVLLFSFLVNMLCFVNLMILSLSALGHFQPLSLWILLLSYSLTPSGTPIRSRKDLMCSWSLF